MTPKLYWLASYPKSGNTWMRAFITNLRNETDDPASINALGTSGIASDRALLDAFLGFETADLTTSEIARIRPEVFAWKGAQQAQPTYHKIHDALERVPGGRWLIPEEQTAGVLYMLRNPLDVALSYANHRSRTVDDAILKMGDPNHRLSKQTKGTQHRQVEQRMLTWSQHVESWTAQTGISTLIVRYEDMLHLSEETFQSVAAFLGLPSDRESIADALRKSSFNELRRQEDEEGFHEGPRKCANFFRQGQAGGWQTDLSDAQINQIIADHGLAMRRFGYLNADGSPRVM